MAAAKETRNAGADAAAGATAADGPASDAADEAVQALHDAMQTLRPELLQAVRQAVAQELHAQGARDAPSSPETSSAPHTNTADAGKNAANSGGVAAALFSVDNVRAIEAACLMMAGLAAGLLLSRSL